MRVEVGIGTAVDHVAMKHINETGVSRREYLRLRKSIFSLFKFVLYQRLWFVSYGIIAIRCR